MDIYLFEQINGLVHISPLLDYIAIFLASYLEYFLVVFLLIFLFWPKREVSKNKLMVISGIISGLFSRFFITTIIRYFYHHPRPYIVLETAKKIINESQDYSSFPSGHAAFFFALATGVYFYNKKLGIFFFISAIIMGIARIFVGVHWPIDILAGAVIGIISAWSINKLFFKKYGRFKIKNQRNSQLAREGD